MANRLRELREQANISQRRLATITGISQYVLSNVENHKQQAWPGQRKKLAIALETPEEIIFPDECKAAAEKAAQREAEEARFERLKSAVFAQSAEDFE